MNRIYRNPKNEDTNPKFEDKNPKKKKTKILFFLQTFPKRCPRQQTFPGYISGKNAKIFTPGEGNPPSLFFFQSHDGTGLDHLDKKSATILELQSEHYDYRFLNAKTAKSSYVKKNGSVQLLENYNYGECPPR